MASPIISSPIIRFGLFELDLQTRELRKSGVRIKLQDQPFQILTALLERPGEIVTREELQKRLWPADTFVDFDLSLNSAVKKLRVALSDDSENPRFIETLYRRGYRFIGPVSGGFQTNGAAQPELATSGWQVVPEPVISLAAMESTDVIPKRGITLLAAAAVVGILLAVTAFWLTRSTPIRAVGYTQITHDARLKEGIVTDGQRLYFYELQEGHFVAAQASASGGDTVVINTPFRNVGIGDIAPDGSALLLANLKNTEVTPALWSLPLPAGAPRRLGDVSPTAATFSPDGSQIAFAKGPDIYFAKSDGTDARKIATASGRATGNSLSPGIVTSIRFSPDGQRLRFTVNDSGTASQFLWEMKRDGSGMHQLLTGWNQATSLCCGNWTPDGKYYIFQNSGLGKNNIWVLPEKQHWFSPEPKPVQLTNGPLQFSFPVAAKEGNKIFMVGSQQRAELLHFDPKSGWVPYLGGASAIDLAFSPDGQWVAYVSLPDYTLWRSRIDGSSPMQLTSSSFYVELPRWSPDGKQIVFMGRNQNTNYRAYVVSAGGGELRELIPGAQAGYDPAWSANGKSIVLCLRDLTSSMVHGSVLPSDMDGEISVLDLATNKVTSLPDSKNYFSPRPSPDGKYIAAITKNSDRLVLFDVAKQRWADLTQAPFGPIAFPNWSRDGQFVYFDTTFGDDPGIFRVRVADHRMEKIASLEGVQRFQSSFGSWSGLGPDDSPLVPRDNSNQEIYALEWEK
jgi:Tol biopolymer transport system component/DNA-binding winged helix-turn-helix (wHTH) protein